MKKQHGWETPSRVGIQLLRTSGPPFSRGLRSWLVSAEVEGHPIGIAVGGPDPAATDAYNGTVNYFRVIKTASQSGVIGEPSDHAH